MLPPDLDRTLFTRDFVRVLATLFFALLALGLVLACVEIARAQDSGRELGVVAAHECGLTCSADEVAALWAVMTRVERRHPARQQCPRLFAGLTTRPYVLGLSRTGARPIAWPARWRRETWLSLLATADAVVRGERRHACELPPAHWGNLQDRARARAFGFRRISCGDTRNDFYVGRAR